MCNHIFVLIIVILSLSIINPTQGYTQNLFPVLEENNVISGYADGTLRLNETITRAEALKVLIASYGKELNESIELYRSYVNTIPITDIEQGSWYEPYIVYSIMHRKINIHPDGTVRPNHNLTGAEALYLIDGFARFHEDVRYRTSNLLTNKPNEWYTYAASAVIARNLISEPINLKSTILRRQFFEIVERLRTAERYTTYTYTDTMRQAMIGRTSIEEKDFFLPNDKDNAKREIMSDKSFAISIPKIGIQDIDINHPEKTQSAKDLLAPLEYGLGHLFSYPGEGGNVMVYGHSSNWPWVVSSFARLFATIDRLHPGDPIYLTYQNTLYMYTVTSLEVTTADDLSAFESQPGKDSLTLYTCWPIGQTRQRLLVHANLKEVIL